MGPGKGSHTPLGTSNEQFHYCLTPVINLHEHPPPLRSPPTPSPRATLPSPLHPSFSSQRSSHPSRRIRTHHSRSFPSSPPPRYTRFFSLPRPRRTPFLLFWTRLEEVSAWREGGGGEGRRGTHRDTERPFLRLAFRLRRSNEEREAYFRPLFARRQRSHTFPAHHPLPSFHLSFAPFGLKSSGKRGECKVAEKTEERSTTLGICPSRLAAFFAGEIVVRRFIYPTPHRGKFTGFDDDADKSLATTFNRVPYIYIFLLLATSSRCAFVRVQRSRESVKIVYIYIEYKYKNSHDDFSHRDRSVS